MPIKPITGVRSAPVTTALALASSLITCTDAETRTSVGFKHCRGSRNNIRLSVVVWYVTVIEQSIDDADH